MNDKARQYKLNTTKRLFTLTGNQCAEPSCTRPVLAKDGKSVAGKICHIEGASKRGPRYNPNMTDDERRHFDNLVILCDECHTIIDNKENEATYPVELLKKWKSQHEEKQSMRLVQKTSLLSLAISKIANVEFCSEVELLQKKAEAFDIEDKISYNAVKRNKSLIQEHKIFYGKISNLYKELEEQGSFKKENLLRNIKALYLKVKGRYLESLEEDIETIRKNADNIIEDIETELFELIDDKAEHFDEDITFGVSIIMVDAFMRCKILEEPVAS